MSKRSPGAFKRIINNAYYTPVKAIMPLLFFLERDEVHGFVEPCCGTGNIVNALVACGYHCASATDITMGIDAREVDYQDFHAAGAEIDAAITNPPYDPSRKMMREIIENLRRQMPTWLLLEADFAFNQNAAEHMKHCSDVVVIGRVQWFPGTDKSSQMNYAWYRFQSEPTATTIHPWRP